MGYTANMLGSVTKYTKMADKEVLRFTYENLNEEGTNCRIYRTTIVVGTW